MDLPLPKGVPISREDRAAIGRQLRALYEQGATVKRVAMVCGRSPGWTWEVLREAGTVMRVQTYEDRARGDGARFVRSH
jgi:Helix-turn-helix domain